MGNSRKNGRKLRDLSVESKDKIEFKCESCSKKVDTVIRDCIVNKWLCNKCYYNKIGPSDGPIVEKEQ